jgi:hypothetical protein
MAAFRQVTIPEAWCLIVWQCNSFTAKTFTLLHGMGAFLNAILFLYCADKLHYQAHF